MVDVWNGYGCSVAEVLHRCDFRFGLEAGHEPTRNTCNEETGIDKRDNVCLVKRA